MRLLIANRGEIARRIIRTARRLGHETIAAWADPDADAPFVRDADIAVRLGPAPLAESYLSVDAVLAAARETGADAVHPGYGFLSEDADFARAVVAAGLVWIGPNPDVIAVMGSKIEARRLAVAAGVPVIPGHDGAQDDDVLANAAGLIGYPVMIKAAAGGGGRGIRLVHEPGGFVAALAEARTEAQRSFGDDDVIVERFVTRPRHVEVQVMGDRHGTVVHLGTRECSVQRRYQKLLEEAPAPGLSDEARAGLCDAAVALARSVGYDSAGTVEFVVDGAAIDADPTAWFFLEMNTRLQVEHPVTEAVYGVDLVELQLASALGAPLPPDLATRAPIGHAIEVRINAEDPTRGFAPRLGTVGALVVPDGVRWDSAIETGSIISPHYDAMVAKCIVHGGDREAARRQLARALDELLIGGIVTTAGFHRWLVGRPELVAAAVTTRLLDEIELPGDDGRDAAAVVAARLWRTATADATGVGPWGTLVDFRVVPHTPTRTVSLVDLDGVVRDVEPVAFLDAAEATASRVDLDRRVVVVNVAGWSHTFEVLGRSDRWAASGTSGHGAADAVTAPFPALVAEVHVTSGDVVAPGDALVVIEAMKMLHTLGAAGPGTVDEVRVAPGDQVVSGQTIVTFVAADDGRQSAHEVPGGTST